MVIRNGGTRAGLLVIAAVVFAVAVVAGAGWFIWHDSKATMETMRTSSKVTVPPIDKKQENAVSTPAATSVVTPALRTETTKETTTVTKNGVVTEVKKVTTTTREASADAKKQDEAKAEAAKKQKQQPKQKRVAKKAPASAAQASVSGTEPLSNWKHWGAAPYATDAEVCRKIHSSLDSNAMNQDPDVVAAFKKTIPRDCSGGKVMYLTPDMVLEKMWSGPDQHHATDWLMDRPRVAALPVAVGPDGRHYKAGTVFQTAQVIAWSVEVKGKTHYFGFPPVCNNVSWWIGPAVQPQEICGSVDYTVEPGDQVWFKVYAGQRFRAGSRCWTFCDGGHCTAHPTPCLDCKTPGRVEQRVTPGYQAFHTGHYVAKYRKQRLYFPLDIRNADLLLCAAREHVQSEGSLIHKEVWTKAGRPLTAIIIDERDFPLFGAEALIGQTRMRGEEVR